jgi:hypothetical protein
MFWVGQPLGWQLFWGANVLGSWRLARGWWSKEVLTEKAWPCSMRQASALHTFSSIVFADILSGSSAPRESSAHVPLGETTAPNSHPPYYSTLNSLAAGC